MKQKLFSLLALFLFVSIGLTTDTKADSMGNELNSSVSENLKALTAGNPKTMLDGFNKHKNTLCSIRANRMCSM